MMRRVLAIASFVLVLPVVVAAVLALVVVPEAVGISMRYPEALALALVRFLFPLSGAVASFCNGLHLYRGSVRGSFFRRLLHVSNVTFAALFCFAIWLLSTVTVGYGFEGVSFTGTVIVVAILATPLLIVAIYMVLLFWRGAVDDPAHSAPMPDRESGTPADEKRKEELEQELRARLEPGETLLWSGQPWEGLILRAYEPLLIPFTLAFTGVLYAILAQTLTALFLHSPSELLAVLASLVLVPGFLFGAFYLFAGRFLFDGALRKRTLYAVTNRRLLILSGLFRRWMRERSLEKPTWIRAWRHLSGRMTLVFGPMPAFQFLFLSGISPRRFGPFVFEHVEKGDEVLSLLSEMKGNVDATGKGRDAADLVLKIVGVLSFALAAAVGLGLAMEMPALLSADDRLTEGRGIPGIFLLLLSVYAVSCLAAAFGNGVLSWRRRTEGAALPAVFHLTNGLFLGLSIVALLATWQLWDCCTVGVSANPAFFVATVLPVFIVFSGYFMILVRHRWSWKGGILEW
jgi:hypothetical protein